MAHTITSQDLTLVTDQTVIAITGATLKVIAITGATPKVIPITGATPKVIAITEAALKAITITEAVLKVITTEMDHKAGHKVIPIGRYPNQVYLMTRIEVLTMDRTIITGDDPRLQEDKDHLLVTEVTGATPKITAEVAPRPGTDHPHLVQTRELVMSVDQRII